MSTPLQIATNTTVVEVEDEYGDISHRPAKKRFTTAKDRRKHLKKNFSNRVGDEGYRPKIWQEKYNNRPSNSIEEQGKETCEKQAGDGAGVVKEPRKPKRKVAVLVGFCGTGYQGMQTNPGAKTIEEDLFKAFVAAGAVSKDNSSDPKKVGLMRAARTDKGVHAAGNVISIKLITDIPNITEKINENLPDQIRMWGYSKVIRSFHAKTLCDSRIYEYLLPSYVFIPPSEDLLLRSLNNSPTATSIFQSTTFVKETLVNHHYSSFEGMHEEDESLILRKEDVPLATQEEMVEKKKFRIPAGTLELIRQGFKAYEGTHNYHNFTIGRSADEKSCDRYIINFEVSDPLIVGDTEWLSLKVHGQSFMLHQIRKMVSLIVLVVRSETPLSLIPKTFESNKINIPKAPALGLLLEQPIFKTYNKKAKEKDKDLVDFEVYREKIDKFKSEFIYSKIFQEEIAENTFQNWLNDIDYHTTRDYGYLNKEGIIPEDAIVKTGSNLNKQKQLDSLGIGKKSCDNVYEGDVFDSDEN